MIKLKNVKKKYGDDVVIKDLNLNINEEEITVIIGDSGSGKTTLLNALAGFDSVDSGQILIDSIDITNLSEKEKTAFRRGNIGFIFQEYLLFDDLTVFENVYVATKYNTRLKGNKSEKKEFVNSILLDLGINEVSKHYPHEISGGQKQRVAIARALATNPKYILADEPTGALDSKNSDKVLKMFLELQKNYKLTLIIVTHSKDVEKIANRIIRIEDGVVTNEV